MGAIIPREPSTESLINAWQSTRTLQEICEAFDISPTQIRRYWDRLKNRGLLPRAKRGTEEHVIRRRQPTRRGPDETTPAWRSKSEPPMIGDQLDGRPRIARDWLLDRLLEVHGQPRPDLVQENAKERILWRA